jgi:enediyne core biosynthesis thioesterase
MRRFLYQHIVTLDETNVVGNVYFAHYLHWQGHCREHFLAEHTPGVLAALRSGELIMATVSCAMEYYSECYALDVIDVDMTLRAMAGNRIVMDFDFRRDHQIVSRGTQTVVCMLRAGDGLVPTGIPDELTEALRDYVSTVHP